MKMAKGKHSKGKKSMSTGSLKVFLSSIRASVTKAQAHIGHWPRRFSMNLKQTRGRFAATLAIFATAIIFVACGGGGGGTTPPPPPPDPVDAVITLGATVPASGATDVKVGDPLTVTWSVDKGVYDSASATLACDGTNIADTWSANKTGGTFTAAADLPRGATCSFQGSVTAKGIDGGKAATKNWNVTFQTEAPVVYHYTDKVYVIQTDNYLFSATKTEVAALINKTQYQDGAIPLYNCWLPKPSSGVLADGTILASCQDAISSRRHYLYIHPVEQALYEYTGPVPAVLACTENADKTWACPANHEWVAVQPSLPAGAPAGAAKAVQVGDGWYYTTTVDQRDIFFVTNGNVVILVKDGKAEDLVVHMEAYSN